jgi:SAM-dependent methyltransferase
VIRRRGIGYLSYLVNGFALPRLAYAYGWGPSAPPFIRGRFRRACANRGVPTTAALPTGEPLAVAMERLHQAKITGVRTLFDGDGPPELRQHRAEDEVAFAAERDADREAYNARFGASLLTEASARDLLRTAASRVTNGYKDYAPIDFGGGLTLGRFVTTDSGTGRWQFFNRSVVAPLVRGRRVVDLGCNNGSMPLMMLRDGARSVVGIEGTPEIADLARTTGRILSWRDMRAYDFRVITGDMRRFITDDLGSFDVVTAFCSLYYLPVNAMAAIVARAAAAGATLVLQANESIRNLPARTADLTALMEVNGYPGVAVHRYPGFGRPILVGSAPAIRRA